MRWSFKHNVKALIIFVTGCVLLTVSAFAAASGTHIPIAGVKVLVSGATDNSMSNETVTVTAKGSAGVFGFGASAKTATITIYNESTNESTLSFDWTATSIHQLTIDGTVYTGASGSFSKVVEAGKSFTATIVTAKNNTVNKLEMKNFSIVGTDQKFDVTFEYNSTIGSITVGGSKLSPNAAESISASGVEVVATPVAGATFAGWVDKNSGSILSKNKTHVLMPSEDTTVMAVFESSDVPAWFLANGTYWTDDLNDAVSVANNGTNKTVIQMSNGILPAGSYTIASGVTLLIPYDENHTLCTKAPTTVGKDNYWASPDKPTAYRTLTMASGAHITVNGAISVSGKQLACSMTGSMPTGPVGYINMVEGSTITVNSGANLYAWGYITGSGTVTVKSGGTVYEDFQIADWLGGNKTKNMAKDESEVVFPISQYYVQNVETPMTFEAGAKEYCHMSAEITMVGIQSTLVPFIGGADDGAMFTVISGSVKKSYDGSTDRLILEANGDIRLDPLVISIKLTVFGTITIDSTQFNLPINSNMTIQVNSGTITINQNLAVLPGVQITIAEGAKCVLGSGVKLYIYDSAEWGKYVSVSLNKKFAALPNAPGRTYTRTDADLKDVYIEINGTLDASNGFVYTTKSGAAIVSTKAGKYIGVAGRETETKQVAAWNDDTDKPSSYASIPITPAKLKNGTLAAKDYTETAGATTVTTYYYCADCTTWVTNQNAVAQVMGVESQTPHYHSLAETVTAYDKPSDGKYIQMLSGSDENVTLESGTVIDLNGCNITGITTLSGTLYGADSSSNGFQTPKGSIAVSGNGSVAPAAMLGTKGYVAVGTNDGYQFHRFAITPISCRFYLNSKSAPTHSHLAFKAALQGSDEAISKIKDLGFVINDEPLWYGKAPVYTNLTADEEFSDYKTVSLVAVDYAGTEGFDTPYTITARAAFDDNHMELISGVAVSTVSMSAALEKAGITIS